MTLSAGFLTSSKACGAAGLLEPSFVFALPGGQRTFSKTRELRALAPRSHKAVVVAKDFVATAESVYKFIQVLVDNLADEGGVIRFGAPGVDLLPADLGVALVVHKRRVGKTRVVLADVLDDRPFAPRDPGAVGPKVLVALTSALLVNGDEIQPDARLSGEVVLPGVAMRQQPLEQRGEGVGAAGSPEP